MKAILYTTSETRFQDRSVITSIPDPGEENQVLNIYEEITDQTLEGFGGALTDAAGFVFSQMEEKQQDELLDYYFNPKKMGYNQVRIPMDGCDFVSHTYEADPYEEDEDLERFSFADTLKYIIPLLDAAEKKAGKKLKIMLSPWSPPVYMKTNKSRMDGGSLLPQYRARWAKYLCRYIQEFRQRGYEVVRMSIQNEPHAVQTWDSCVYTAQEEKEFLRDYLAPELKAQGLDDVELLIWDHNKERIYERVRDIVDDTTRDLVSGAAFHWYSGDHFEGLNLVHRQYPQMKLILSESCLEFGKYDKEDQMTNANRLAHDMIGNLNAGMVGFYDWNILLDAQGGPNHKKNYCDAPFLYDEKKHTLIKRKCLEYYWHFTHFVKPGAVRVAHTSYSHQLDFTAWKNQDGQLVFVLLNRSKEEMKCNLRVNGELFACVIDGNSIVSGELKN